MADLGLPQRKTTMDWANEVETQRRAFEVWRRAALIVLHEDDHEIVLDEAAPLDLPLVSVPLAQVIDHEIAF